MIKEAIDRVLALSPIQTTTINDLVYVKGNQQITRLKMPDQRKPDPLRFNTLTGFADYVEANPDNLDDFNLFVQVTRHNSVELHGQLQPGNDNTRFSYAAAYPDGCHFCFGQWQNIEDMIVLLQTCFARPEGIESDVDAIIDLIGNIASERIHTQKDDGFSQRVEVRSGLASKSAVKVENPVRVHPWQTFVEIDQPEMSAVLRFREVKDNLPMVGLFSSVSTAWQLQTAIKIREWLIERLPTMRVFT